MLCPEQGSARGGEAGPEQAQTCPSSSCGCTSGPGLALWQPGGRWGFAECHPGLCGRSWRFWAALGKEGGLWVHGHSDALHGLHTEGFGLASVASCEPQNISVALQELQMLHIFLKIRRADCCCSHGSRITAAFQSSHYHFTFSISCSSCSRAISFS